MTEIRYQIVVYKDDDEQLTTAELAATTGLHPALIERFVDFGLIEPARRAGAQMLFYPSTVLRIRTIERLRKDVGVSVPSLGIVLDLIDKIWELKRENEMLRSRL
ncbi:MAG TPA: chaperone modulator CbpM [Blastocatellia bacterium]|nr:chaperone modulator CbpM [Blastocatellia bacterium]